MEHFPVPYLLMILVALLLTSAFFSASEIGMMSLNRYRLRHLVNQGNKRAIRVQKLLSRTDKLLGVILIGNTFANIFAGAISTIVTVQLFDDFGVAVGTVVLTMIILIFSEITPKIMAALHPERVAFLFSPVLLLLSWILSPLVLFSNGISNGVLRLCGVDLKKAKVEHLSGEELRTVVFESGGLIPDENKNMLISILDLEKVTVDDIMVPRAEIIAIDLADPWDEILERLQTSQHTRLPVYHESIDKVIGIVHLRSILNLLAEEELTKQSIKKIMDECYFTPEGTPLHTQLLNFKKEKTRTALVVDEYGDIQGLVTLEDILEEIVGEFTTDIAAIAQDYYPQEDGTYLVDGGATIRDLNRALDWMLPSDGPKTLSGLIIEQLEAIPSGATSVMINGYPIEVISVQDNKVKTARVQPRRHEKK